MDISYVHPLIEHSWGQKVVRFYDPVMHIIEVGEIDEVAEMLGWEEIAKIDALREGTEKNLQDLFADITFMNDNSYYFTKNNLTQINPTDFAKGKELEIFDNKKQEYLRKKSKFPTVQKGNLFYQKYWEIQTK